MPYQLSPRRTRYRVMRHGAEEVEQLSVHRKESDAYFAVVLLTLKGISAWVESFEQWEEERTTP